MKATPESGYPATGDQAQGGEEPRGGASEGPNSGEAASFVAKLEQAWQLSYDRLHSEKSLDGSHWEGQLSTSALSTATAISAMVLVDQAENNSETDSRLAKPQLSKAIQGGCEWLAAHQNPDGGFGDTDRSHSNIATTFLVVAAWKLAGFSTQVQQQADLAWAYIESNGSWDGLRKRYGKDKTFVVPILSNCALAGIVPWKKVPTLPFEAAWLPQSWYRFAQMPVVSYAVPALVAIGQAKFHFSPPVNPATRMVRKSALAPTLRVLRTMQPASGGYLEAVPLTSFVLMSLAAVGNHRLPVAQECLRFILESQLEDNSWPIDTNLATWVTSLSTLAISRRHGELRVAPMSSDSAAGRTNLSSLHGSTSDSEEANGLAAPSDVAPIDERMLRWLLRCQHMTKHPFTGANPGGWGWTNLSGAVPDADDTPAALLALSKMDLTANKHQRLRNETLRAVARGVRWLYKLQNRDGGWPTFCRGWGKLPFDRSGTDLTAHAIRALRTWRPHLGMLRELEKGLPNERQLQVAEGRGFRFLERHQRDDGSWLPLWFGNQDRPEEDNPVYGTGKVLLAYAALNAADSKVAQRGIKYLQDSQNSDGGWGGGYSIQYAVNGSDFPNKSAEIRSTIEESAIALEGLILCGGKPLADATIMRGLEWLSTIIQQGNLNCSWPIGFYFAKLWYHERLYPTIFSLSAIGSALERIESETETPVPIPG